MSAETKRLLLHKRTMLPSPPSPMKCKERSLIFQKEERERGESVGGGHTPEGLIGNLGPVQPQPPMLLYSFPDVQRNRLGLVTVQRGEESGGGGGGIA